MSRTVSITLTAEDAALLPSALWALIDVDGDWDSIETMPGAVDAVDRLALTVHRAAKEAAS